ncbi:TetR/AcrR family transcriptional regulator [Hyphococcus luteus]|uniref:TetR/AcrR family transcriptional regulator n=1 Tax=Hyphococcus luteus TaxID=2058213 RepID=UPI0013FD1288|nr:TetR/AcrR family transcriptional regulator [Marinicaulis flavus]
MDAALTRPEEIQKKSGYHHGNLRSAIFDAVAQLIGERKSLAFHLKDVAALVGTSQPAIYKHFENKQSLLVETAVAGYGIQKKFRDYALDISGPSPLQQLLAVGYAYVHFSRTYPGYFLLMKNLETDEILSSPQYQRQRDETLHLVRSLIAECMETGLFHKTDLNLVMTSLQSTALGLANMYLLNQLEVVARDLHKDKHLVSRIFKVSIESFLTPEGKRHIRNAGANPFEDTD